jgi:hypothetical protein
MAHILFFSRLIKPLIIILSRVIILLGLIGFVHAAPNSEAEAATAIAISNDPITSVMPENIPKPLKVGVSLILNNLISLDEKQGTFEADVDLTLTWNNPNLIFDPKTVGTSLMNFNAAETPEKLKTIWSPQITISNIEEIINDVPSLTITPDGTATYIQRIKAGFKITPDLRAFPFDKQSLTFYLDATNNTTNEVAFTQTQRDINHSGVRDGVHLSGWSMQGIDFKHSLVRSPAGGFYPRFEAEISMSRIATPHLFAFAPLLLIMLSPTLMTLFSDFNLSTRLTAWGASLLTLMATSFALNQKYPALESNSILPEITSIVLIYQFLMIILTTTLLNPAFASRFKDPYIISELVDYLRWAIPLALILLVVSRVLLAVSGG